MATYTNTFSRTISDIVGYCFAAEVRVGGNGAPGGVPEYDVTGQSGTSVSGRFTWDSNPTDGFAGFAPVNLAASSGSVRWSVTGGTVVPIVYSEATFGSIQRVEIRAAVQTPATMSFDHLDIIFMKSGVQVDRLTITVPTRASTSTEQPPGILERVMTVTPAVSNSDSIQVISSVTLSCPAGTIPQPNDIFGQIFVFAN